MYIFPYIKLQSYWTKAHEIYAQYSQIITDKLFLNQNGDIAICFGMPVLQINVNSPILPILSLKLVAMATSLEQSQKRGQIGNLRSNTYHMAKIGLVDPEIALLKGSFNK